MLVTASPVKKSKPVLLAASAMLLLSVLRALLFPVASADELDADELLGKDTLIGYIAHNQSLFSEKPFNEADSLVLSTAAYLNFEEAGVGGEDCLPLSEALFRSGNGKLIAKSWLYDYRGDAFVDALRSSNRYVDVKLSHYVNEVDESAPSQFCAMTFECPDGTVFVAFRGTDNSIAGWEEDAALSYAYPVRAQELAAEYLSKMLEGSAPGTTVYVGGHSKGGNIAEYAACANAEELAARLSHVRSYDAPGNMAGIGGAELDGYTCLDDFKKYVPSDGTFGLLFEKRDVSLLSSIEAIGDVFAQHATTNWLVNSDGRLSHAQLGQEALSRAAALNEWAEGYSVSEREELVDTFFSVVRTSDMHDWVDFKDDPLGKARTLVSGTSALDASKREAVLIALGNLASHLATSMSL